MLRPDRYPFFDKLLFGVFVLLLPVIIASAPKVFDDGDVSWHIAAGRWILAHRAVPATDPFSFTFGGHPWVAFEWLSEVIYAAAFNLAGYPGVAAVVALAIMALHFIIFVYLRRRVGPVAILLSFLIMDAVLAKFVLARPHVLVWPLLAGWTAALLNCRDRRMPPRLPLAMLMFVWANLHGSFILGFAIAAAIGVDALIAVEFDKRAIKGWLLFALASTAGAMLNANGLAGFLHPLTVIGMTNLNYIQEWQPSTPSFTPLFYLALLGLLGALMLRGVRFKAGELVLLLLMLGMAFSQVRHQSWLAIIGPLLIAPRLARNDRELAAPLFSSGRDRFASISSAVGGAVIVLAVRLALPLQPTEGRGNPRSLLANIPDALRRAPVLNEYSFGGPLILAGIRPYIDGRSDMYGDAFVTDYTRIADGDLDRFNRAVRRYGIQWTMLPPSLPLTKALDGSPQWHRVYADRVGVIHVRRGELRQASDGGPKEGR